MLERIRAMMPGLRKSEQKIAELVLKRPHSMVNASVAEVARDAAVSQPTVVRFCRAIGCAGFQDFKLRLAQDLATGTPYVHEDVKPDDPIADVAAKVLNRSMAAIARIRNQINADAVGMAVDILCAAKRLEFYGFGASGIVAMDAQNKFFRLGLPCTAYTDFHVQAMSAAILGPEAAVLAISHTGRTRELLRSVELALESGAKVIALTTGGTPLAERATVSLLVDVEEDTSIYTPMTSRLSHLAMVDVLQVGVALRRGTGLTNSLVRSKRPIRERRTTQRA
ncbi:transcriptional regulator HexR [Indioceanicola profundi]|uniref:transcriptional regulator HexR n=1 Tax=Indioceanicola profundi TaxID=2220096 RepID=UPI000E6AD7F3|nr:transcriptional regulator HexR [Indioceanicola profundi]